jgi:hypothetical protein
MSFTLSFTLGTIVTGPERASRSLQSSEQKYFLTRTLEIPLKEFFQKTIEYYLQIFEIYISKLLKTNVHKSHPKGNSDIASPQKPCHKNEFPQ